MGNPGGNGSLEYLNRKEEIIIRQNKIKEQIMINSLNNLHFCSFVDEKTKNRIRVVLQYINAYNANPEKIIFKENEDEINIENLKKVVKKIQNNGKWLIPSPADISSKWYEVEVFDINLAIRELFKLYGEDFFTIVLKDEMVLIDVFWDEEYKGIHSTLGIYCIFIKNI